MSGLNAMNSKPSVANKERIAGKDGEATKPPMGFKNWPSGLKHTKQREGVYNVLLASDAPLSAADIYENLSATSDLKDSGASGSTRARHTACRTNLSTVYRVLEAFAKAGLVERTTMPGADTAFYKLSTDSHTHYATCLLCHKQIPLSGCPVAELKLDPDSADNFVITGHRVELFGYCKDCADQ